MIGRELRCCLASVSLEEGKKEGESEEEGKKEGESEEEEKKEGESEEEGKKEGEGEEEEEKKEGEGTHLLISPKWLCIAQAANSNRVSSSEQISP